MFRLMTLFAGLSGLLASRPGKPVETLVTRVWGWRNVISFFQPVTAFVKLALLSKKVGVLPYFLVSFALETGPCLAFPLG